MAKKQLTAFLLFLFFCHLVSYAQESQYKSIIFGNQTWMAANLDVAVFRNGDSIPQAKTNEEWIKAGKENKPAWCYYNNNPLNGKKYGKLYNWYAVNDSRGLAPEGWHIPTRREWDNSISDTRGQGGYGKQMKSTTGWDGFVKNGVKKSGNGTNEQGFNALPSGDREDKFNYLNKLAAYWCSNEQTIYASWYVYLYYELDDYSNNYGPKENGLSVRCIKDQQ
jgi:uncharacterized protein (TIGR02145 family)